MNAKRGRPGYTGKPLARWSRHGRQVLVAGVLAFAVCVLVLLVDAIGILPGVAAGTPLRASVVHAEFIAPTNTPTPTPSPSPTSQPGTLQLVSPTSGKGPAGAHLTVSGSGFTGSNVTLFASSGGDCGSSQTALTNVSLSNGSFNNATFIWPTTLPTGQYSICAPGMTNDAPTFTDVTTAPPVLSLSTTTTQVNQAITITGHNFVGMPVITFKFSNKNTTTSQSTLNQSPDPNGDFSFQYTPDGSITGQVDITALSQPEAGAQPVLQAKASLLIQAAVTPTPTLAPTTAPAVHPTVTPTTTQNTSSANGIIIVLVVVIVLILLAILGVVAYFMLRNRDGGSGPGSYPGGPAGPGGYGDYGDYGAPTRATGVVPPYGGSSADHHAGTGVFGRSGIMDGPRTGQYGGLPVGGVAQWEETAPQPGADWQPRPMSGNRRDYDDPGYAAYPPAQGGGAGYPGDQSTAQGYAPADPWGDASGNFGGPPSAGGQYGDTRAQGAGGAAHGWDDERWRGTHPSGGATRPESGRADW